MKTKQNKTKQNKTKQNKTKQNKTKQNKTKQNKTYLFNVLKRVLAAGLAALFIAGVIPSLNAFASTGTQSEDEDGFVLKASGAYCEYAPRLSCDLYVKQTEGPTEEKLEINVEDVLTNVAIDGISFAAGQIAKELGVAFEIGLKIVNAAIENAEHLTGETSILCYATYTVYMCRGYVNGELIQETIYKKVHTRRFFVISVSVQDGFSIEPSEVHHETVEEGIPSDEDFMAYCCGRYYNEYHLNEAIGGGHKYKYECSRICDECGNERSAKHIFYRDLCTEDEHCIYCGTIGKTAEAQHTGFVEATCGHDAYCTDCTYVVERSMFDHIQSHVVKVCEDRSYCPECGWWYPPAGHDWIEATCDEPKHCSRCPRTEGNPLGHIIKERVVEVATCTSGEKKEIYCNRCKEVLDIEYKPELGHDDVCVLTQTKSCTQDGFKRYECKRCGRTEDIITGKATGHGKGVKWTEKNPTCTSNGYGRTVCEKCGERIGSYVIYATGHTEGAWETVTSPSCTAEGKRIKRCTDCDTILDTETIKQNNHKYERYEEYEPTCTSDGAVVWKCEYCGDKYNVVDKATGHKGTWVVKRNATCSATGLKELSCTKCGMIISQELLSKIPHEYKSATCTSPKTCINCHATSGSALGHSFSGAYVDYDDSSHAISCSRCNHKKLLSHVYKNGLCKICGHDDRIVKYSVRKLNIE